MRRFLLIPALCLLLQACSQECSYGSCGSGQACFEGTCWQRPEKVGWLRLTGLPIVDATLPQSIRVEWRAAGFTTSYYVIAETEWTGPQGLVLGQYTDTEAVISRPRSNQLSIRIQSLGPAGEGERSEPLAFSAP